MQVSEYLALLPFSSLRISFQIELQAINHGDHTILNYLWSLHLWVYEDGIHSKYPVMFLKNLGIQHGEGERLELTLLGHSTFPSWTPE